uniref:Uncharacterized protein n=1 Tax=Globodera rostochiensis TaxID=31243 RepID=A0A914GTR4_GLORO
MNRARRVLTLRNANASNIQQRAIKEEPQQQKERPLSSLKFGGGTTLIPVEYSDDIDLYLRHLERRNKLNEEFLSVQNGVDGRMRQILVDWLVHVQVRFKMSIETLSLSVHILDRSLLALTEISKQNLQLVGVTCMFIASKYEEVTVPNIEDFVYVAANVFDRDDIMRMEQRVLSGMNFNLSVPYSMHFLRRYRFYISPSKDVWVFAKFISEVALVCYALAHHSPSVVAAVSIHLSSFAFGIPLKSPELFGEVFRMADKDVVRISRSFVDHVIQFLDPAEKLFALREKYRNQLNISNEQALLLREFGDYLC